MNKKFEGGPKKTDKEIAEEIKEEERKRRLEGGKDTIEEIQEKQRKARLEETIETERGGF